MTVKTIILIVLLLASVGVNGIFYLIIKDARIRFNAETRRLRKRLQIEKDSYLKEIDQLANDLDTSQEANELLVLENKHLRTKADRYDQVLFDRNEMAITQGMIVRLAAENIMSGSENIDVDLWKRIRDDVELEVKRMQEERFVTGINDEESLKNADGDPRVIRRP